MATRAKGGFRCSCEVRETPDKGLGVFAKEPIPKGFLVWRFSNGHYEVYDEPGFRTAIEQMTHTDAVYELTHTFGLRDFPTCLIRVWDDGALINHSGNATVATNVGMPLRAELDVSSPRYLRDVVSALREDRFALIATRNVEMEEELTTNYFEDEFDPPFLLRLYQEFGVEEDYLE